MAPYNGMLFQAFEWHTPSSPPVSHEKHNPRSHYARLTRLLPTLSNLGITAIWLPPGCKAMNRMGNGYDVYDIWDLGEFDQKGARSTKWGSYEELRDLLQAAKNVGMDVIWDTVINHKTGGDSTEDVWAVEVDKEDRTVEICPPRKIQAWLRFDFPGREQAGMPYSSMRWRSEHFNGTDWDHYARKNAIYKQVPNASTDGWRESIPLAPSTSQRLSWPLVPAGYDMNVARKRVMRKPSCSGTSKPSTGGWANDVDDQHGNDDYLMFNNIDFSHRDVRQDILRWGSWMVDDIGVSGFRLDAAQHISYSFLHQWIEHVNQNMQQKTGREAFIVGEVWSGEVHRILRWLNAVQPSTGSPLVRAFDAPLLYKFSHLSESITDTWSAQDTAERRQPSRSAALDLRTILEGSLTQTRPDAAVTLVTNHDSQFGQTCATPMDRRLKPLFYAFILLRQEGMPCVFWGDLFATKGPHAEAPVGVSCSTGVLRSLLAELMMCRKLFAHGKQVDYWQSPTCIGWTRAGDEGRGGCAVILSVHRPGRSTQSGVAQENNRVRMEIGRPDEVWTDILAGDDTDVTVNSDGCCVFPITGPGVKVFVRKDDTARQHFPVNLNLDVYEG